MRGLTSLMEMIGWTFGHKHCLPYSVLVGRKQHNNCTYDMDMRSKSKLTQQIAHEIDYYRTTFYSCLFLKNLALCSPERNPIKNSQFEETNIIIEKQHPSISLFQHVTTLIMYLKWDHANIIIDWEDKKHLAVCVRTHIYLVITSMVCLCYL